MSKLAFPCITAATFLLSPIARAELSPHGLKTFRHAQNIYVHAKYNECLKILATMNNADQKDPKVQKLKSFCKEGQVFMRTATFDFTTPQQNEVLTEVEDCRVKLRNTATKKKMKACLKKALKLDPDNPEVVADMMWAIEQEQARKAHSKK